jgi:hypothetical protein
MYKHTQANQKGIFFQPCPRSTVAIYYVSGPCRCRSAGGGVLSFQRASSSHWRAVQADVPSFQQTRACKRPRVMLIHLIFSHAPSPSPSLSHDAPVHSPSSGYLRAPIPFLFTTHHYSPSLKPQPSYPCPSHHHQAHGVHPPNLPSPGDRPGARVPGGSDCGEPTPCVDHF